MKRICLLICFCTGFYLVKAQGPQTTEAFTTYSTSFNTEISAASQAKDGNRVLKLLAEWLKKYEEQTQITRDKFKGALPNMYYNQACYQALAGQHELAISSFQKAVDTGYANYTLTLTDSDLNSLRNDKRFKTALLQMRQKSDYGYILKTAGNYRPKTYPSVPLHFTYQPSSAPELMAFKNKFNLDSVSGNGDEVSRIKNLLTWVHNQMRHDGGAGNPSSKNGIDLIEVCRKENRGVNCRMLATVLKDAYQAEGFAARMVTCMPKDTADFDCHVINMVWSKTLNKWLWMDPTNNAYVSDDKGNLLGIEEVRQRLINNRPLVLNAGANWNNRQKVTKEDYLYSYMSKNLYWLKCSAKNEWDLETMKEGKPALAYIDLYPGKYSTIGGENKKVYKSQVMYATGDPGYFWQKP